jgi:four helix bundle protein
VTEKIDHEGLLGARVTEKIDYRSHSEALATEKSTVRLVAKHSRLKLPAGCADADWLVRFIDVSLRYALRGTCAAPRQDARAGSCRVGVAPKRRTSRANCSAARRFAPLRLRSCHASCAGQGMTPTRQEPYRSRFLAFDAALALVRCVRGPIEQVATRDRSLADQLRRAASSVPLNVSEGNRRTGKDRIHLWRVAAGSADEVRAALLVAEAWGYLDQDAIAEALDRIDQMLAILWRLTH